MKKLATVLLAIILVATLSVTAFAASSPSTGTIVAGNGGKYSILQEGDNITLTATPDSGNSFLRWEIEGEYTIVSGDLNSSPLVISGNKDNLKINCVFVDPQGNIITEQDIKDKTSPKTGDVATPILVTISGAALAVCLISKKKVSCK